MNKQKWIDYALSSGFESFEIYQSESSERTLSWYEGKMDTFVTSKVLGTSLRGVISGKTVNFATEDLSDSLMETVIASMKEQASAITSDDPGMMRKPEPFEPVQNSRTWHQPSAAQIRELLADIEQKILSYDERIFQATSMEWSEQTSGRTIVNSLGVDAEEKHTVQVLACGAAAKEGSEIKNDYCVKVVTDIETFDRDAYVKELCESVLNKLNASSIASGNYPVIIEHEAMTSLFTAFSGIFSGELIGKGISPLKDALDTQIFSGLITVIDDPRNTDSVNPAAFDDEGCPTYRKTVVDHGVFRTILHSTASGARMNMESTGNGFKGSYTSAVGVRPMNCFVEPGDKTLDELCADMKEGLVITSLAGLHAGINFITTNFSLQCSGYLVKDGKRDRSVTLITIAGNFLDLMKHVTAVGNDADWSYKTIAVPSIAFESCAIAGE
ncbi:MAG: TldD/PmbA family protein [Solobacterium sp.]|nr:TldD/PmbA family protein [Solobacterium sp.]